MTCNQRCDINADGVVDARDRSIFISAYGSRWGDSNYNRLCDFNGDGSVDEKDLAIFEESFGCTFGVLSPASTTVCTPGERRCYNGTTTEVCKADGTGWTRSNCASGYECKNGVCVKSTTPTPTPTPTTTTITCTGATPNFPSGCALLRNYDEDKDGVISGHERDVARFDKRIGSITPEERDFVVAAENAGSINNLCHGCSEEVLPVICTPGKEECIDRRTKRTCKSDGTGWITTSCDRDHECVDGECVYVPPGPVCTPGETRCYDARSFERCSSDGMRWDRVACPQYYICIGGKCVRSAQVCTPGEKVCTGTTSYKVCKSNGSGWDYSSCPTGYECKNGECVKISTPTPTPTPTPTQPNMETRTVSLTEGQHTIQVSLSGYDTLNATINVSSSGVSCRSVTGGSCSTSGWTVTTGLTPTTTTGGRCAWIATQDTSKVAFISEMVLAYLDLKDIGFVPSAAEIGDAVLMYLNLGTPESLWEC